MSTEATCLKCGGNFTVGDAHYCEDTRPMHNAPCQVGKVEFNDPSHRPATPMLELPPWKEANPHLAAIELIAQRERLVRDLGLNEDELSILSLLSSADHLEGNSGEYHDNVRYSCTVRLRRLGLLVEVGQTEDGLHTRCRITALGKALVGK